MARNIFTFPTLKIAQTLEQDYRNTSDDRETHTCPQVELLRGRDGRDGARGEPGAQGQKGDRGLPGPKGEPGAIGPEGPQGRDGGKGDRGDKGEAGTRGLPGDMGERGLPGVQGPVGISGSRGPVGDKGDRGSPGLSGPQGPHTGGGTVYTRWGRTSCPPSQGTTLVYSGRAGGSTSNSKGGAANIICLPDNPEYSHYASGVQNNSPLRGAQYRASGQPFQTKHGHNIPCAVCSTSVRSKLLVIPAKLSCPANWTTEYTGYLMAGRQSDDVHTLFECVDDQPESVPGLDGDDGGNAQYFHVEATCNSLSCPPYDREKEVTCVVCTQ